MLNFNNLKTRSLSSIVYVVIFLGSLYCNHWLFLTFCIFIHWGCWYEYQKICVLIDKKLSTNSLFHNFGIIITGMSLIFLFTQNTFAFSFISVGEIGWWMFLISVLILPIIDILFSNQLHISKIFADCFGIFYISISIALFMQIRLNMFPNANPQDGILFTFTMVISIWLCDSFAYLGGSIFGRTPFFPSISPKKTWEGTLLGIVISVSIVSIIAKQYFSSHFFLLNIIASVSAIVGTIGDLLESKLKRLAQIKDSGSIMPGHGGFLDRFDSILLASPFVWLSMFIYFLLC